MSKKTIWIRCADTDMLGVVYYARFLEYFEEARWDLLRKGGFDDGEIERECRRTLVVRVECDYLHPVRFNETIEVEANAGRVTERSYEVLYAVTNMAGMVVAKGRSIQSVADEVGVTTLSSQLKRLLTL